MDDVDHIQYTPLIERGDVIEFDQGAKAKVSCIRGKIVTLRFMSGGRFEYRDYYLDLNGACASLNVLN